jgi:uncharacterized protein (DUF2062 family)
MFSLFFLGVLICNAIEMGYIYFIKAQVGHWILHKKQSGDVQRLKIFVGVKVKLFLLLKIMF